MGVIFPYTSAQCSYLLAIQDKTKPITIVTGPAGSGKTQLACAEALGYRRIILTRPTLAADESLGYLPGDIDAKMEPWARPMLELLETGARRVSVEPLGFLRGRTFMPDSFVIADEMQNATESQMRLLLTRIGEGTKLVITGDLAQSDLGAENGLSDLVRRVDGLHFMYINRVELGVDDVVRHPAVKEILKMYKEMPPSLCKTN